MAIATSSLHGLIGREKELKRLTSAIRKRESLLVWGPAGAGKNSFVEAAIKILPAKDRSHCIRVCSPGSIHALAGELVRGLYFARDTTVRRKVSGEGGASEAAFARWLRNRSSGQLKSLLYGAAPQTKYWILISGLSAVGHAWAHFLKEMIWRAKTPIYLISDGCTQAELGCAWSIYFTPEYHVHLGPLHESQARQVLEESILRFGLERFDLDGFRRDILRLSGHLPGAIVKMCELAVDPRYHFGDRIKVQLLHVDYLMKKNPRAFHHEAVFV